MAWPEVTTAKTENRRELILNGAKINKRIEKDGFDNAVYELTSLNYLDIHQTILNQIPDDIGKLQNLQTLVLHSNKLQEINPNIFSLKKLKVLDLSGNQLQNFAGDISKLELLDTLNLSLNQLEELPDLSTNIKLAVLNVSRNKLKDFSVICTQELTNLADLNLNNNVIEILPNSINMLTSLKNLDLSSNKIKIIPGELSDCNKLKDINLKDNPISDRRLLKLIDQCRTKQIVDYVKQHCTKSTTNIGKTVKNITESKDISGTISLKSKHKIYVKYCEENGLKIVVKDEVKSVRGYILGCLIHNVKFSEESFRKFIQLQTKLHEGICEKRNAATIATHDATKLQSNSLLYTACMPKILKIKPLMWNNVVSGAELYTKLQNEADALRKEKKRNVYSGIHKYLYLLEGKRLYPCLMANDDVISFPPITNSDLTKISAETTSMLLEVTSATSQFVCKKVLDALIKEMVALFEADIHLEQVKNVDIEGNMKAIYPSRADLVFEESSGIEIVRD